MWSGCHRAEELQSAHLAEWPWNSQPKRVIAPYAKGAVPPYSNTQVPRDTRNPVGIREDHLPRLNTSRRPIVNQYREGKVKSTPVRGVKEYLKPSTYNLWKPSALSLLSAG